LGLFTFGILTKKTVNDRLVPYICIAAPLICFFLDKYQKLLFGSFELGLELLIINGTITFIGLFLITKKSIASA
jgi:mannitol-specific phosphotransferase system IIBC component